MFVHFLITRFNIVQDWYTTANRNHADIQTNKWLDERFRLYEQYCLPSVANQDTNNFVWLVLYNSETPNRYKEKISQFQKKCKMFMPVFLEPYGDEGALIQNLIDDYITADTTHIITTRLDNDDMIRNDYISMIQKAFKYDMNDVFLDYGAGFQFNEKEKVLYYCPNFELSHYVSRVVNIENKEKTVLVDHSRLKEFGEYKMLKSVNGGAWIETVHSCNAWNRLGGWKPIYKTKELQWFPCVKLSFFNYLRSYTKFFISKSVRWIIRKFHKHILKK